MKFHALAATSLFVITACASSASAPDTAEYQRVASSVSSAATTHASLTASMTDVAACTAERDRYAAQMRPLLDRMQAMSGDMDDCAAAMGRMGSGSMRATCSSMRDEMDRHMSAACASPTMSGDVDEANVHAGRMTTWANGEATTAGDMRRMMGGGMMGGGSCHM